MSGQYVDGMGADRTGYVLEIERRLEDANRTIETLSRRSVESIIGDNQSLRKTVSLTEESCKELNEENIVLRDRVEKIEILLTEQKQQFDEEVKKYGKPVEELQKCEKQTLQLRQRVQDLEVENGTLMTDVAELKKKLGDMEKRKKIKEDENNVRNQEQG
jgi:chromosome segregation ATPase